MRLIVRLLLIVLVLAGGSLPAAAQARPDRVPLDESTAALLDEALALRAEAGTADRAELIDALSELFLGRPYLAGMLVGSATRDEQLVIDFRGLDCFTYLDYVHALTEARTRDEFVSAVVRTRYRNGLVGFQHRRHFFTDWAYAGSAATDVTAELSPAAVTVGKQLNVKPDGGRYLPGLPVTARDITFIPAEAVDADLLGTLRTGDYLGAYSPAAGLDVTHVGIVRQTPDGPMFRNASSLDRYDRVVDQPLGEYVATIPGIVVLRPTRLDMGDR